MFFSRFHGYERPPSEAYLCDVVLRKNDDASNSIIHYKNIKMGNQSITEFVRNLLGNSTILFQYFQGENDLLTTIDLVTKMENADLKTFALVSGKTYLIAILVLKLMEAVQEYAKIIDSRVVTNQQVDLRSIYETQDPRYRGDPNLLFISYLFISQMRKFFIEKKGDQKMDASMKQNVKRIFQKICAMNMMLIATHSTYHKEAYKTEVSLIDDGALPKSLFPQHARPFYALPLLLPNTESLVTTSTIPPIDENDKEKNPETIPKKRKRTAPKPKKDPPNKKKRK